MSLTSHQTRAALYAPEAELASKASSTTDKPISHLHYTEGVRLWWCGEGGWERWSKCATFRTSALTVSCSSPRKNADGGQDNRDEALKTFVLTAKPSGTFVEFLTSSSFLHLPAAIQSPL